MEGKKKMVSMKLDDELYSKAKIRAIEEKRSFTKFVENVLEKYLNGTFVEVQPQK